MSARGVAWLVLVVVYDYLSICVCARVRVSVSSDGALSFLSAWRQKGDGIYGDLCVCMYVCRIENLYVSN